MFLLIFSRDIRICKLGQFLAANTDELIRNQAVRYGRRSSCVRMINIVAAGKGSTIAHPTIMRNIISLCGKRHPNIVYLGTPSKDSIENWVTTGLPYVNSGYSVTQIHLWNQTHEDKENQNVKEILLNADIILVSGGSSKECILKWREHGVDELLLSLVRKKKSPILAGGSAGALCWFGGGYGLGLIPALFVPHFDINYVERGIIPPDQKLQRFPEYYSCICMDENAAIVISSDKLLLRESVVSRFKDVVVPTHPINSIDFPDVEFTIISTDGKAKGYVMRRLSIPKLETLEIGKIKRFQDLFLTTL